MTLLSYHQNQLRIEALRSADKREAWTLACWIAVAAVLALAAYAAQADVNNAVQWWRG